MHSERIRAAYGAAFAALILAVSVFGAATPANAHSFLVSSTPEEGEILTELPAEFEVTMNEPLLDTGESTAAFALQVVDDAGLHYEDGCLTLDGPTMSTPASLGEPGNYTIIWQLVSADGHTVSEEYEFEWAPAESIPATIGTEEPRACGDPAPSPTPTATASPTASPTPAAEPPEEPTAGEVPTTALWVGGAVVALGVIGAILLARRRSTSLRQRGDP